MFCEICNGNYKNNSLTLGCETFRTSLSRHEETDDHRSNATKKFKIKIKTYEKQDRVIIKAFKIVYYFEK